MSANLSHGTEGGIPKLPSVQIISCDDVACEPLIDPIPRPKSEPFRVVMQPKKKQVVLWDNGKPNSLQILKLAHSVLRARGVDVRDEIAAKPISAGLPMNADLLAKYAHEDGLFLMGIND
jgi:hypothetical protein